jgi:hypothetical protein
MIRASLASSLVGVSLSLFVYANGIAAQTPSLSPPSNGLSQLGQQIVEELKKPEYAVSRCVLTPVLMSDNMSVAVSVDRVFSAGDVLTAVSGEPLDATAKTPLKDLLMKHSAVESVAITIRRAGKEIVITAKCADAKPMFDSILEAAFAASKNDAATCADKMDASARLHTLSHGPRVLAYRCYFQAKRFSNMADNTRSSYEMSREWILESAWSPDALSNIRGGILSTVDWLQKNNASLLADDLKQQYDQAVSVKSSPVPASANASR